MTAPLHRVYLSLGSNIKPLENLRRAVDLLRLRMPVTEVADAWETPPVGSTGPNFFNTCLAAATPLNPKDLKETVLRPIETHLGRVRTSDKYAPRTIDLDIIIYDDQILDDRLWTYLYLAAPMAQLLPYLRDPNTGRPLSQIAEGLLERYPAKHHPDMMKAKDTVIPLKKPEE